MLGEQTQNKGEVQICNNSSRQTATTSQQQNDTSSVNTPPNTQQKQRNDSKPQGIVYPQTATNMLNNQQNHSINVSSSQQQQTSFCGNYGTTAAFHFNPFATTFATNNNCIDNRINDPLFGNNFNTIINNAANSDFNMVRWGGNNFFDGNTNIGRIATARIGNTKIEENSSSGLNLSLQSTTNSNGQSSTTNNKNSSEIQNGRNNNNMMLSVKEEPISSTAIISATSSISPSSLARVFHGGKSNNVGLSCHQPTGI
uniref:Uncharacterized protein n=1 Tax=Meloidogyne hapla TaxID=6305 RepID=A0A1I8BAE3_MELHA